MAIHPTLDLGVLFSIALKDKRACEPPERRNRVSNRRGDGTLKLLERNWLSDGGVVGHSDTRSLNETQQRKLPLHARILYCESSHTSGASPEIRYIKEGLYSDPSCRRIGPLVQQPSRLSAWVRRIKKWAMCRIAFPTYNLMQMSSLYHEPHSADAVSGGRRRRTSLTHIVSRITATTSELVKPVVNSGRGWSSVTKGRPESVITFFVGLNGNENRFTKIIPC
ncbi:hypothetical protein EVAR_34807_1 [Eumeta japonica]|uniref:Uncharacterized protein n=1 Tax=Eumeta variegata TaxID=151549 RepID=A0A4C1WDQ5_EUMVA|nr:hypothetical protein EVAR_34807_1 [Eumeta japonica]